MARIKLNDHYFVAWLHAVKKIDYIINENKILVDMSPIEYTEYLQEYTLTLKPVLVNIRKTVKVLASLTSKP